MNNPFRRKHDPVEPRPGGIDGVRVDWVRWYPPDTPFRWGQGFQTVFSNVPAINGGRWLNQFLPDKEFEVPPAVSYGAYAFPAAAGSSGAFQAQLVGGNVRPATGITTARVMEAHAAALQRLRAAGLDVLAGGFARS